MVKNPLWLLLLFFGFVSCHDKPTFPITPKISLNNYYFVAGKENTDQDTLFISLKFEDGDGDLGLGSTETAPPYQEYDFVVNGFDTLRIGDNDTLPEFNCYNYQVFTQTISVGGSYFVKADTFYVIRNANYYNYFLDFYTKEDDGFVEYDTWGHNICNPFDGRFFELNTVGDVRPLTGDLEFKVVASFRIPFRYETLKLRIQIQDRALHKSNILETDEFSIMDI